MNPTERHPIVAYYYEERPMRSPLTTLITLTALASFTLGGCEKKNDSQQATEQSTAAAADPHLVPAHAQTGVQPGSHEDWCGEHQVPESMCTRCNASLIAAFKATGDWCEEHGLPESQCLICNPGLKIERPARAGGTP
jgi:hypothetical protein